MSVLSFARRAAIPLLVSLVAAGCATPPPPITAAKLPTEVASGHGIVLVKITNLQRVSFTNAKWTVMRIKNITTGKALTLVDQASSGTQYSIFTGAIPAGTYKFDGLAADGANVTNFGWLAGAVINAMSSDDRQGSEADTFTVGAGELTNLGVILSSSGDKPVNAVIADQTALATTIADLDSDSQRRLNAMPSRSWDRASSEAERKSAESLVRTKSTRIALDFPQDGRVFLGTPLGLVHERGQDGRWTTSSTGSADNITAVRLLSDGRLFAATDSARYYIRDKEGHWTPDALPSGAQITAVEPVGEHGLAVLAQKFRGGVSPVVFAAAAEQQILLTDEASQLRTARAVSATPAPVGGDTAPAFFFDGNALLAWVNHAGISRTADLYVIDPATLAIRKEELDFWGRAIYRTSGNMLVRERMNGLSVYADFSNDNGKSWRRGEHSAGAVTRFVDAQSGYSIENVSTGWSSVAMALSRTTDGGKSWIKTGKPFEVTLPLSINFSAGRVFVYTGSRLQSTNDEGNTWQVEWPRPQ